MLRDLVPSDLVKTQNPNDWKRSILHNYSQDNGMTADDAKVTFLKIIYRCVPRTRISHSECGEISNLYVFADGQPSDQRSSKSNKQPSRTIQKCC